MKIFENLSVDNSFASVIGQPKNSFSTVLVESVIAHHILPYIRNAVTATSAALPFIFVDYLKDVLALLGMMIYNIEMHLEAFFPPFFTFSHSTYSCF